MKQLSAILILLSLTIFCSAQQTDTLYVNYYAKAPFATLENGEMKGLEIDIINEYGLWLKSKKHISLAVKFNMFNDFEKFFASTKGSSKNTIGLGSVTINPERSKQIDFTSAYLKNVSFCITNGNALEIKSKTPDEIVKVLGSMTALTLTNTTLNKYVNDVKKTYIKDLKITERPTEIKILDDIAKNVLYFGYVDAVGFWLYLKNNPQKFLKTQKLMNQSTEELGFIVPKGSSHKVLFNEFFNSPAGFKKSQTYKDILEKHLGSYMTQAMAVK